jgi:hypothetical protein
MRLQTSAGVTVDSTDFAFFQSQPGGSGQTATVTDETWGGITLNIGNDGTADKLVGMSKAMPSTPFTITAHVSFGMGYKKWDGSKGTSFGIHISEDSTDRMVTAGLTLGYQVQARKYTADDAFSATAGKVLWESQDDLWLQIEHNGTTVYWRASGDGINFLELHSEAKGTWPTGADFTHVGFFGDSAGSRFLADGGCDLHLNSWTEE